MKRWLKWLKKAGWGAGLGLLLSLPVFAQSPQTVTAKMTAFTNATCPGGTGGTQCYAVVTLRNFSGNIPRVVGTTLIAPTKLNVIPDSGGNISFTLWTNDLIQPLTCNPGGTTGCTFYEFDFWFGGKLVYSGNWQFFGTGPFDLTTLSPLNQTPPTPFGFPVLLNPNGDQTIKGNFKLSVYNLEVRNYSDYDSASTPANPPSGVCRVWYNGTVLSGINNVGGSCMPSGGGGGSITAVNGTANQITSTNPGGPVVTLSFPNSITFPGSATVTSNLNVGGSLSLTGLLTSYGGTATAGRGLWTTVSAQNVGYQSPGSGNVTIYNTSVDIGILYRFNWALTNTHVSSLDSQLGPLTLRYTMRDGVTTATVVGYAIGTTQTSANPTNIGPLLETQDNTNDVHTQLLGQPIYFVPAPNTSIIINTTCSSNSDPVTYGCNLGYVLERF